MSAIYSMELIVAADRVGELASALQQVVVGDSAARNIKAALDPDDAGDTCLTIAFPADDMLVAFSSEHPDISDDETMVAVGCFWTSSHLEGTSIRVSFASEVRAISALLKESESVRSWFRSLGEFAVDGRVLLVDDQGSAQVV